MQQLGEYLILGTLGRGGMGIVYAAEERLSRRPAALKVLNAHIASSDRGRELFVAEMGILARLDHPNVVRLQHCCEVDGRLMMALDLVKGETLRQLLTRRGRLAWQEVLSILHQVLAGLGAAHSQPEPVVHRDLKPENVMVEVGGTVKVMDFGIAKILAETNRTSTSNVGTLQYMSPEQLGGGHIDARSDLYNVGLLVYELLGGSPPFAANSAVAILAAHCNQPPPPLPPEVLAATPERLVWVMGQLLAKAPEQRPANAGVVAGWIQELGSGQAIADVQPSAPKPLAPEQPGGLLGGDTNGSTGSGAHAAGSAAMTSGENLSSMTDWSRHGPTGAGLGTVGLVDAMARPTSSSKGGSGRLALMAVLGVVALGGISGALWWGMSGDPPTPAATTQSEALSQSLDRAEEFQAQITKFQNKLSEGPAAKAPIARPAIPVASPKPSTATPADSDPEPNEPTPSKLPPAERLRADGRVPPILNICPIDANDDGVTDLVTLSESPQVLDAWDGKDGAHLWTHKPLFQSTLRCVPGSHVGLVADEKDAFVVLDVANQRKSLFADTKGVTEIRVGSSLAAAGCIQLLRPGQKRGMDVRTGKDTSKCANIAIASSSDGKSGLPPRLGARPVLRDGVTYTEESRGSGLTVKGAQEGTTLWTQAFRHKPMRQRALLVTQDTVVTLGTVDGETFLVTLDSLSGRPGFEAAVPTASDYVGLIHTEQDFVVAQRDALVAINAVTGRLSWARWSVDGNKKFKIPPHEE